MSASRSCGGEVDDKYESITTVQIQRERKDSNSEETHIHTHTHTLTVCLLRRLVTEVRSLPRSSELSCTSTPSIQDSMSSTERRKA